MQGARRGPWWLPRASRATPQTPLSLPTLRDRGDFPSCRVVASLLGHYPTASAPPCLRGNLPRSRPREILRQAPKAARLTARRSAASAAGAAAAGSRGCTVLRRRRGARSIGGACLHQRHALIVRQQLHVGPPLREFLIGDARLRAQQQKIVRRTEPRAPHS